MGRHRKKPDYLTEKEFNCLELYIQYNNASKAGIEAGYSRKTASVQASRLIKSEKGKKYLNKRLNDMDSERIASTNEILEYLTNVMRGEIDDINLKTGGSQTVSIHERTLAAQELARRLIDMEHGTDCNITIINDIPKPTAEQMNGEEKNNDNNI